MDKIGDVGYKFQNCLAAARESAYATIGTAAPYRSACPCGRPNEQLTKNALLVSQQAGRLAVGEGGRPGATKPLWGQDGFAPCGWAERVEEWLRYRSLRPVVAEQP